MTSSTAFFICKSPVSVLLDKHWARFGLPPAQGADEDVSPPPCTLIGFVVDKLPDFAFLAFFLFFVIGSSFS
jgi:hypothetical protein